MITQIIDVLRSHDFYGQSKTIEFAKGSNQYTTTLSGFKRKTKRKWRLREK